MSPHPLALLPFAALLLAIALMPLVLKHQWERWFHLISVGLGSISVGYYVFGLRNPGRLGHVAQEYVSFIALIGSLFVVAGGIHIVVKGEAKPWVNSLFLFLGALIANLIGTTGASMLLIRPWIRMNRYRFTEFHAVFFIFIVSNVGGCLTPIGDPPLFLGYLKGVPFWWVIEHCWEAWGIAVGCLIAIFYGLDRRNFHRAPRAIQDRETASETWKFTGLHNVIFLAIILGAVFVKEPPLLREALMIAAAFGSWFTTPKAVYRANQFTMLPIKEVAWLFAGIFATMVPVLDYLDLHAATLGIRTPLQFYWFTGLLSGMLDNAPTYLSFLASAFSLAGLKLSNPDHVRTFTGQQEHLLLAISLGAVFFGALTYIGNGPNLMVKSIADAAGVKSPGFFGYVLKYALPILLPVLALIGFLFFRAG